MSSEDDAREGGDEDAVADTGGTAGKAAGGGGGRRRGLGRGLNALLGDDGEDQARLDRSRQARAVPTEQLRPGSLQPRTDFDVDELQALAQSVREKGILQPILVRRDPDDDAEYEIIAGERRWRAAQLAQLHEVPILVREFDDREVLEIALIENIQRQDLSPLEEAEGFRKLVDDFDHTQEDVAQAIGRSRSHVANTMRLLTASEGVRELLAAGDISAGHARALIGAPDADGLAAEVVRRGLNVRATERLVRDAEGGGATRRKAGPASSRPSVGEKDADILALERSLSDSLGLRVEFAHQPGDEAGTVSIHYQSLEQLDGVLAQLMGEPVSPFAPPEMDIHPEVLTDDDADIPGQDGTELEVSPLNFEKLLAETEALLIDDPISESESETTDITEETQTDLVDHLAEDGLDSKLETEESIDLEAFETEQELEEAEELETSAAVSEEPDLVEDPSLDDPDVDPDLDDPDLDDPDLDDPDAVEIAVLDLDDDQDVEVVVAAEDDDPEKPAPKAESKAEDGGDDDLETRLAALDFELDDIDLESDDNDNNEEEEPVELKGEDPS